MLRQSSVDELASGACKYLKNNKQPKADKIRKKVWLTQMQFYGMSETADFGIAELTVLTYLCSIEVKLVISLPVRYGRSLLQH